MAEQIHKVLEAVDERELAMKTLPDWANLKLLKKDEDGWIQYLLEKCKDGDLPGPGTPLSPDDIERLKTSEEVHSDLRKFFEAFPDILVLSLAEFYDCKSESGLMIFGN